MPRTVGFDLKRVVVEAQSKATTAVGSASVPGWAVLMMEAALAERRGPKHLSRGRRMALLGQGLPVQSGGDSPSLPSAPMMSTIKARTGDRVAIGAPSAAAKLGFRDERVLSFWAAHRRSDAAVSLRCRTPNAPLTMRRATEARRCSL